MVIIKVTQVKCTPPTPLFRGPSVCCIAPDSTGVHGLKRIQGYYSVEAQLGEKKLEIPNIDKRQHLIVNLEGAIRVIGIEWKEQSLWE